jgi:hypothetical protein
MIGPLLDAMRVGLAVFGAACVLGAVAIAFDIRGSASRLVHAGEGLASHWWGLPFRGTYTRGLVRVLALGLLILGLDGLGAASGVAVTGTSTVVVLLGWAYTGLNLLVWVRSGHRSLVPLISLPIVAALVVIHLVFVFGIARWLGVPPG